MTSREHLDPYVVLGVCRQASPKEIARAYRRAARATHPDRAVSGTGAEGFNAVSDAYDLLRDPGRRARYDQSHPLPRGQTARAGGSVRYAAPGSQHVVLGSGVGEVDETASTQGLGDIEEMFRLALSLLHGSW
jgi:molecular chaperone DnaJ